MWNRLRRHLMPQATWTLKALSFLNQLPVIFMRSWRLTTDLVVRTFSGFPRDFSGICAISSARVVMTQGLSVTCILRRENWPKLSDGSLTMRKLTTYADG